MKLNPYLSFDGHCREAFEFYERVLGGKIAFIQTIGESSMAATMPEAAHGRVMHVTLHIGEQVLQGADAPIGQFTQPAGFCVAVHYDDAGAGERVFDGLAQDGHVQMPFQETFWARGFGMCIDRFGTPWIVNAGQAPRQRDPVWDEAVRGLHRGDFDALAPLFVTDPSRPDQPPRIVQWHVDGLLQSDPVAAAEALSCASFLGATTVAQHLLAAGIDPTAGAGTGMSALHWAVNRGQVGTTDVLLAAGAPLEEVNMHGTTVLGTAVWSALNEPKSTHLEIIEKLLKAGAKREGMRPLQSYVEGRLTPFVQERIAQIEAILAGTEDGRPRSRPPSRWPGRER